MRLTYFQLTPNVENANMSSALGMNLMPPTSAFSAGHGGHSEANGKQPQNPQQESSSSNSNKNHDEGKILL